MGFDPTFSEVEYRSCFECALGDAEGTFHYPQTMILDDDFRGGEVGIGNVAFESVPLCIGGDSLLVNAYHDIVPDDGELVVTALVDVPLLDFARGVCFAQPLYPLVTVVPVFCSPLFGVADNDTLITVDDCLVKCMWIFSNDSTQS